MAKKLASQEHFASLNMEAPGGVEPPTNGLGNWGYPLHRERINNLRVGLAHPKWVKSGGTALIWQRFWQHNWKARQAPGRGFSRLGSRAINPKTPRLVKRRAGDGLLLFLILIDFDFFDCFRSLFF